MARKFDFDYNFDPEGTSLAKPDPYTDDGTGDGGFAGDKGHRNIYDGVSRNVASSSGTQHRGGVRKLPKFQRIPKSVDPYADSPNPNEDGRGTGNHGEHDNNSYREVSSPPKAYRRSHTPTPAPQAQLQPSPEYLATSQESSSKLAEGMEQRKLLILDLNGTLVFRSPHQRKNAYQLQGASRPLRSVHRRPYLQTFTDYLFHPEVTAWLDTMVWSSAQPHSVADMVGHCFGGQKDELLAVWARDTLGLSYEEYHRKTQTTKNLEKPWAALQQHSAKTTLLLDDSPLKAHLQPWNHLCIKEYVSEMRQTDVIVREAELLQDVRNAGVSEGGKRKGGGKEAKKLADRAARATANASESDGLPLQYDETLLAVVGVLDAVKEEGNVAAWMRSGGLTHVPHGPSSGTPGPPKKSRYSDASTRSSAGSDSESTAEQPRSSSPAESPSSSFPTRTSSVVEDQQEDTGVPLMDSRAHQPGLWFDHPDSFGQWVERGRRALDLLGVEVYHGIIP